VINTAIATAATPLSGTDATLSVTSDEAVVDIAPIPSIAITKTSSINQIDGNTTIDVDDEITYTIVVTNTGNTALTGIDITDTLTAIGGGSLSLDAAPAYDISTDTSTTFPSLPTLQIGEAVTYTATFTVNQAAIDAAGVSNTASVVGYDPDGVAVNASIDDPVVDEITQTPSIEVTKTAAVDHITGTDSETTTGDTIVYTITIENTGNVTLTGIDITDTMTDGAGQSLTLTSPSTFSTYTLAPGETEEVQATYTIEQSAADTGSISNTVSVVGTAPDGTEISDELATPVVVLTNSYLVIDFTKYATITDTNGDGSDGIGDLITYDLVATNTGNVELSGVMIVDVFSDLAGNSLTLTTGPIFISASLGSEEGSLQIGEQATYRATFIINSQAMNAGGVSNTASAFAISPSGVTVSDVSDDGDDTDGNTENDPTVTALISQPIDNENILLNGNVYITKSNGLIIKSGDDCFRIKVNNGNVVAEPVNCE
jgi:uncharacterized repeat protein (TIGR01451 family)